MRLARHPDERLGNGVTPHMTQRTVLVITGSRGEWGYIRPILRQIASRPRLKARLAATNMHLLPEYGHTLLEIERDGFEVDAAIHMALDGCTDTSMTKSLGVFLLSIADTLDRVRPNLVLLAGDRGEQLMTAIAAAHMNIPIAHVQAGEVSGNIDGQTRHAIARYAHLHLAANEDAADRLRRTGEQEFRIFNVGAPQLDDFVRGDHLPAGDVLQRFHLHSGRPIVLFVQHPVTEQFAEAGPHMELSLEALRELGHQTVLIYPNNDAGSAAVRAWIARFQAPWLHVERSVSRAEYAGLMRVASVIVGNSSSGLLEAPSFELPAVNIGRRQDGRMQGRNVINVPHDRDAILCAVRQAMTPEFRKNLEGMENPYGDGRASERIVRILEDIPIDERLLFKRLVY